MGRKNYLIDTRIELLGFKGLKEKEKEALTAFIDNSTILNLEEAVILETIRIRKTFNIKLPDSIIAATCLVNKASLITNNIKDFDQIPGLHLIKV